MVTYDGPVTIHVNGEDVQLIPMYGARDIKDVLKLLEPDADDTADDGHAAGAD